LCPRRAFARRAARRFVRGAARMAAVPLACSSRHPAARAFTRVNELVQGGLAPPDKAGRELYRRGKTASADQRVERRAGFHAKFGGRLGGAQDSIVARGSQGFLALLHFSSL